MSKANEMKMPADYNEAARPEFAANDFAERLDACVDVENEEFLLDELSQEEILQEENAIRLLMEEYIMPNNFNTNLLEPQEISAVEQQRILNQTMQNVRGRQNTAGQSQRRGLPRRRLWVFGLAAVMLLAMSSLAVAQFALNPDFLGFFNAERDQLPQQSGQEINMQDSNENGTLTVEQVLGDSQSVYVLLDFMAPEGMVLDKETYQWDQAFAMLSESTGAGYYFEDLPDDDPTDNHLRMMLCLQTDVSLKGQRLTLNLGGLKGYSPEARDYTQQLPGEWRLSFVLDYTPTSEVVPQDVDIQLGEATLHVNHLEISPFTIIVDANINNPEGYQPPEGYVEPQGGSVEMQEDGTEKMISYADFPLEVKLGDLLGDFNFFTVTLQDGTVLETSGGGSHAENNHHQIIFSFNQLLNLDDIASINYLGQELKLH